MRRTNKNLLLLAVIFGGVAILSNLQNIPQFAQSATLLIAFIILVILLRERR